jgi:hypothetical protein
MPLEVSSEFQDGLDAHITAPAYLIEILISPSPFWWTTGAVVDWAGKTWVPSAAEVPQVGESGATIKLRNDNNTGSSLVLNNTLRDQEVRIYLYYNGDAKEIFRGYCSDAQVSLMSVSIDALPYKSQNALIPRRRVAAPTFNHLPKLGEVIRWGDEVYKVTF